MQGTTRNMTRKLALLMAALMFALAMGMAEAQQPAVAPVEGPTLDQKLVEWQKTVDLSEAKINQGPMDPAAMPELKEGLRGVRSLISTDSKAAEAELKAQNALLTALGPAPDKDVKEDKKVKQQREELNARISKLDAQIKQASLLTARADKILDTLGKQTTSVKKTELLQKSPPMLNPQALRAALGEARIYFSTFHFSLLSGGYVVLGLLIFWLFSSSIGRMKEWVAQRQVFKAKPRGGGLYLQMLVCTLLLMGDRLDLFGMSAAAPMMAEELRLLTTLWLLLALFIFLSGLKFEVPEGMEEDDTGLPVGFLNFLLSIMRLSALLLMPAALLGYVPLATYVALNMAGSIAAIVLFIAARAGLVGLNTQLAKAFKVERLLSPLTIAFFEPVLAGISCLFAASFWGVTPADVRDWVDHLSGSIVIGSIKLDFSDAGAALAVFFALYALTKSVQLFLSKRLFPQTHMDRGTQDAVYTLIGYTGITIALLTSLGTLGLDMQKLAIVAGALSVGIGFGLQAIVNNFVSGLILLFERPIRVGDYVKVGTEQGLVRRISVRSTELETPQFGSIIVPNSKLIAENVTNWTLEGRSVRIEIAVGVSHAADTETVKKILLETAGAHQQVRKRPEPQVLLNEFTAAGMAFELRCYIRDIADRHVVSSDLRFSIDKMFREAGITRA